MYYSISSTTPFTLTISLKFQPKQQYQTELFLPTWRPGKYQQQAFAARIRNIQAFDQYGKILPISQSGYSSWIVKHSHQTSSITITYDYVDTQPDAGSHAFVDDKKLIITPAVCCLYTFEHKDEPIQLQLQLPKKWQIATSLPFSRNSYHAQNYHELADSPIIASADMVSFSANVEGLNLNLHFIGKQHFSLPDFFQQLQRVVSHQITLFGSCPVSNYHFLIASGGNPEFFFHAVEHANSCLLFMDNTTNPKADMLFQTLHTATHEFFHTWNIKAIRPAELKEYHYQQPQPFPTCYVAEGLTTYQTQLMLWQLDIANWSDFYENSFHITTHIYKQNHSNIHHSLAAGSNSMWLDSFNPSLSFMSNQYIQGMLAWLIVDLEIIRRTNGKYRAVNILTTLWKQQQKSGIAYNEEMLIAIANRLTKSNMRYVWKQVFWNSQSLLPLLKKAYQALGLRLQQKFARVGYPQKMKKVYQLSSRVSPTQQQKELFTHWSSLSKHT